MTLYGLTGGIGSGKSYVSEILVSWGINVVDTDLIARQVVAKGSPVLQEVVEEFGHEILHQNGELNRGKLAELVFGDAAKRARLERIMHPAIRAVWLREVDRLRAGGEIQAVVVIPLLFETGAEKWFDAVICVACSEQTQHARLKNRGWSAQHLQQRLDSQWSMQRKMDACTHVIWNEYSREICAEQLGRIMGERAAVSVSRLMDGQRTVNNN